MANQESTAIKDLIALVHGKVLARESENPVPELFIPAPRPAVRLQETLDESIANVPSLGRAPSGTPAPYAVAPAYSLPTPIAHGTPAQAYRIPAHTVEQDDEQTELWQGTPAEPAAPMAVPMAAPIVAPIPPIVRIAPRAMSAHATPATPRYETSHLPRELSPIVRYAGLGFLALAAITIGTYLGASGGAAEEPNERDRAIAIMSGEMPAPAATTHVTAPTTPTVRMEAAPPPAAATVEPAKPEPVIWATPVVIDSAEIEMEAETRKPAARRARIARIAKSQPKPAIVKKPIAKVEKKKIERSKKAKKGLVATEIVAPKGAAAVQGNGRVTISSNRPALIYLDGRATGKTAPSALVIPAGDHQITLLDPDTKKAKTATVKVAANKAVAVRKEFN